jgi:hypothetical protein
LDGVGDNSRTWPEWREHGGALRSGADLKASTIEAIQDALEKAGVDFVGADDGGPGARLRPPLRLFAGCVNLVTPAGGIMPSKGGGNDRT